MAITQIGIATASQELIDYIKNAALTDAQWSDISDAPDPGGNSDRFLGVVGEPGSEDLQWLDLPPSGLVWQNADTDLNAQRSTGYLVTGGITITLPVTAENGVDPLEEGTIVAIADDKGEVEENPVTIVTSAHNINGDPELIVDIRNAAFQLIFDGTEWRITQLNHPANLTQITEENFNAGQVEYSLSRVPAATTAILVNIGGRIIPASDYTLEGNVLRLQTAANAAVAVRHIGTPPATQLADAPVGMIGMFPKAQIPVGWIQTLGGSISSTLYPDLVHYLTGDPEAEEAIVPDYSGLYFKGWDRSERVTPQNIPGDLSNNALGRWMPSLQSGTAANMWDNNPSNTARVLLPEDGGGFIGYSFDEPVTVSQVDLFMYAAQTWYPVGGMILQSSDDGVTWTQRSNQVTVPTGNVTATFVITGGGTATAKHWRVLGSGGIGDGSGYYWECGYFRFTGTYNWKPANTINTGLSHSHAIPAATTTTMDVAGNPGSDTIVTSIPVSTLTEVVEPDNAEVVVCIKAFHTQSGTLSDTNVDDLREEVNRLAGIHEDIWSQDQEITGGWNVNATTGPDGGGALTVTTDEGTFPVLTTADGSGKIEYTIVNGNTVADFDQGYLTNVDGLESLIVTLPEITDPVVQANSFVVVADYNGLVGQEIPMPTDPGFPIRRVIVNPNGETINGLRDPDTGVPENLEINVPNVQLTFTFVGGDQGWRITNGLGESEAPSAIRNKTEYTNVAGQQKFFLTYEPGYVDVYYNGRKLAEEDFTATNRESVFLTEPVELDDDIVEIVGYNHVPITDGAYVLPYKDGFNIGQALDLRVADNELINGYFQVWQRPGERGTADEPIWDMGDVPEKVQYGPDRWVAVCREQGTLARMEGLAHTGNIQQLPGRTNRRKTVRITSDTTNAPLDTMAIEQRVEGVETGAGAQIAWTFTYRTDLPEISLQIGRNYGTSDGMPQGSDDPVYQGVRKISVNNDGAYHTRTVVFDIPEPSQPNIGIDDNDYISFTFWISAGTHPDMQERTDSLPSQTGYFELAEVKIEGGHIPTPLVAPYTQEELAKCQRYYWQTSNAVQGFPALRQSGSNTEVNYTVNLPVFMRTSKPLVTGDTGFNTRYYVSWDSSFPADSDVIDVTGADRGALNLRSSFSGVPGGVTYGSGIVFHQEHAPLYIDAEL